MNEEAGGDPREIRRVAGGPRLRRPRLTVHDCSPPGGLTDLKEIGS